MRARPVAEKNSSDDDWVSRQTMGAGLDGKLKQSSSDAIGIDGDGSVVVRWADGGTAVGWINCSEGSRR